MNGPLAFSGRRPTRWHLLTISLLFLGYTGYYFCRSDYSVALPLILAEQVRNGTPAGIAQIRLGSIASLGVLAYAIAKFPSGALADRFGGRRNFLGGMFGSILFTVLFMLGGGFPLFSLAWLGNRLVLLHHVRQRHGSAQSQLPFRRRDFARHHVAAAGAWFRLERDLWRRRRPAQCAPSIQSHLSARNS
jgi:MFS family permease